MFAYIRGRLEAKSPDTAVVEAGGIGYRIAIPLSSYNGLGDEGSEVRLFTHMHVREDLIALFGFLSREELGMFEMLITVSGVGPKAAMSVISSLTPSDFALALITDDSARFRKAPGVGAKTAQRIILELKDKIKKEQLASGNEIIQAEAGDGKHSAVSEAISAMMVLGYSQSEAVGAVTSIRKKEDIEDMDAEAIVRSALKQMMIK